MGARVWYELNNDAYKVAMWDDHGNGDRAVFVGQDKWLVVHKGALIPPEAIHDLLDAQGLLDALLQAGVRPSSNAWSAGHVSDLKAHIAFAERVTDRLLTGSNRGAEDAS